MAAVLGQEKTACGSKVFIEAGADDGGLAVCQLPVFSGLRMTFGTLQLSAEDDYNADK